MAPKITDGTEIRFSIDSKNTLRVRSLVPKTGSDFVVSSAGGNAQDHIALTAGSGGIAEDAFYTATSRIANVAPGGTVYVQSSAGTPVIVAQLEKN